MDQDRDDQQFSFPAQLEGFVLQIALVACGALLLGTIIPALVANRSCVFYRETMTRKILSLSKGKDSDLAKVGTAIEEEAGYRRGIDNITSQLKDAANRDGAVPDVEKLLRLRSALQAELAKTEHAFSINPLFLNDLLFAWSGMYTCFGTLAFVLRPRHNGVNTVNSIYLSLAFVIVYLLYQGPVWARNFVLSNEGRKVFSFANYDISHAAFYMQEVNTVLWFALLFIVLRQWLGFYAGRLANLRRARKSPIDLRIVSTLTDTFIQWQLVSTVLALGFVIFTGVFWDLVIVSGDRRYLLPAIVMHTLWALSWFIVSLPLLVTWQDFSRKKAQVLLHLSDHHSTGKDSATNLENLSPISMWNGIGSVLTGIVSFAFPVLHALLK